MRRFIALSVIMMTTSILPAAAREHFITTNERVLEAEDGLLLGNGDLSVSVYPAGDEIRWRFGKGDVWDRRFDPSDDPKPPHISEIAHGIADEGWKCSPYGDGEPVALKGTDNPARMKELCKGAPPSYTRRPYPCPKPVGELALRLPPDLPGLTIRQEVHIESGTLAIECAWRGGVKLVLRCFVPPQTNALVVRWELQNWRADTLAGLNKAPLWFSLYRWADPTIRDFGERFFAESRHGEFLSMDAAKCTPLPPPAVMSVDDLAVVAQDFPADPTFPQGFRYLLAPFLSAGTVQNAGQTVTGEARLQLLPPVDTLSGWVVVGVPATSDAGGLDAGLQRLRDSLRTAPEACLKQWEAETEADARAFWGRSAVTVGDQEVENLWYETYHARRCTTRAGKTPPGLFLPSTVRDYSHWHGDYHTNYNFQQPYWGDYTANQIELGDAYFDGMAPLVQMGRIIAERYYGTRGVFIQLTGYPVTATDDMLGAVPMGRMAYMTGWVGNQYWWRYLYTGDEQWLRAKGYPVLRDCALFYLDLMKMGADGLYHVFPSNQGEDGFTGEAKDYTDRPQVMQHLRYCLRSAIAASEVLGLDAELRAQWQDRLDHSAGDDGQPPEKLEGMVRHFHESNPPEFNYGRPYQPQPEAGDDVPWPEVDNALHTWYPGQYPVAAMSQLRCGGIAPDRLFTGLQRIIQRWRHPNGLIWAMSVHDYGHSGAWTETLGICAPLQEMMLQSFGGVLRLFPCWPKAVPASFRDFRAEGAFLVSAEWRDGAVVSARVTSERGGDCRLYPPWPAGVRVSWAGKRLRCDR